MKYVLICCTRIETAICVLLFLVCFLLIVGLSILSMFDCWKKKKNVKGVTHGDYPAENVDWLCSSP